MSILDLLQQTGSKPLITYQEKTLDRDSFSERTFQYLQKISDIPELADSTWTIIDNSDPLEFYPLLFALWLNKNKVVFPSRDFFENSDSINYYQYAVSIDNGRILVSENSDYKVIDLPKGDVVVFSSGSTGRPKGILHYRDNFLKNAQDVQEKVGFDQRVCLTMLKPYLVSAFSHLLVHYISGSHLVFHDLSEAAGLTGMFDEYNNPGLVGSPMHIIIGLHNLWPKFRPPLFFSSGDFMSGITIKRCLEGNDSGVFFNVYGLAELAGRFFINKIDSSSDPETYEHLGTNLKGTRVEIIEDQLHVDSDYKYSGYIIDNQFFPSPELHPSGDLVGRSGDNIFLVGRADDEIKIGGNKVSIKRIENQVKQALDLDIAVIVPVARPGFGTLLALVLPAYNVSWSRLELITRLRTKLKPFEMPHSFFNIPDMPYTQSLKIDRKKIASQLEELPKIR